MTETPICRYPLPDPASLPPDIGQRLKTTEEKAGFVPNVMRVLSRRPEEFRAFFAYHDALMEGESGLTKAEREMIVVATSGANRCPYCVIAHGAILRIRAKNPLIADQVAVNYKTADITVRERAILDFAMKVATASADLSDADRTGAKQAGLSDEDLWDIAAITAFFAMSNRLASATGMRANDEFYLMGRIPKNKSA
ncbi:MAG: peroxidase-related enzyme [Burkholderiaceae bacterium]|nr:peroxidase-related enzyme [Burkholderiaceae bacterium]